MKVRPNDSPEMEKGELRNATFKITGAVGDNTIESVVASGSGLTLGDVELTGDLTFTVPISAPNTGTYSLKVTATMSSEETLIGVVRVKVIDSTCQSSTDRWN